MASPRRSPEKQLSGASGSFGRTRVSDLHGLAFANDQRPSDSQLTVSVSTLLVPPLLQPTSLVLPLGVTTLTLAFPGAEITLVVSITCNCLPLVADAASTLPLITISDAGTNWLP